MGNTFLFIYDRIEASNKEILIYGYAENLNIFIRIAQRKKSYAGRIRRTNWRYQ